MGVPAEDACRLRQIPANIRVSNPSSLAVLGPSNCPSGYAMRAVWLLASFQVTCLERLQDRGICLICIERLQVGA